jgi:hypothetical protein
MKELEKLQKELARSKMENLRCSIHDRFRVVNRALSRRWGDFPHLPIGKITNMTLPKLLFTTSPFKTLSTRILMCLHTLTQLAESIWLPF